jgi:hypothetical protein
MNQKQSPSIVKKLRVVWGFLFPHLTEKFLVKDFRILESEIAFYLRRSTLTNTLKKTLKIPNKSLSLAVRTKKSYEDDEKQ